MTHEIKKIGFVGLGSMGHPMALRLIQAGFEVTVKDIRREQEKNLQEQGAKVASSLPELAREQDVIITMLQTGEQVRAVCLGEHGLYLNAKENAVHIDASSIDLESSRELHESARMAKIRSLDAPVSGGVVGATNGQLTFAVGGDEETLEEVMTVFMTMGKRIVYVGGPGNGQLAKICNNMILGVSMIAVSEGFVLAEKLGLEADKFFEFSSHASGQCWSMTSYAPVPGLVDNVPANNHYKPGFSAQLMLKDLHLSQLAAKTAGLRTVMGHQAEAMYQQFVNHIDKLVDFSGIIKMVEKSTAK